MEITRKKLTLPARAALWYCVGGALTKGLSLLSTPIFTRMLSPEEYAKLPIYITFLGVASALAATGSGGGARLSLAVKSGGEEGVKSACLGFSLAMSGGVGILYLALCLPLSRLGAPIGFVALMLVIQLIFDGVAAVELTFSRARYDYKRVVLIGSLSSVFSIFVSYLLINAIGDKGELRALGLLLSSLALGLPLIARQIRGGRLYDREVWRELFRGELPMLPQYLSGALLVGADKIMIGRVFGELAVSGYVIAHSIGGAAGLLVSSLSSATRPWLLRRLARGDEEGARRVSDSVAVVIGAFGCALIGAAPEIARILAPSDYGIRLSAAAPIALSAVFGFLSLEVGLAEAREGRAMRAALPGILGVLVSLLMNYLLLGRVGYEIAGFTALVSSGVNLALICLLYKKGGKKLLFSPTRLFAFMLLFGGICALSLYFEKSVLMRGLLSLIAALAALPDALSLIRLATESR